MKNEEKAKEIAEKNGKLKMYLHGFELVGAHFDASPECYDSAMEMAKCKDEQIVGILKIVAPMIFGGQKNQIRDLLGWDINWDDYKEM